MVLVPSINSEPKEQIKREQGRAHILCDVFITGWTLKLILEGPFPAFYEMSFQNGRSIVNPYVFQKNNDFHGFLIYENELKFGKWQNLSSVQSVVYHLFYIWKNMDKTKHVYEKSIME